MATAVRFFKVVKRSHPSHRLPTVMWNAEKNCPEFDFTKGPSGYLEFTTDNPALIKRLTEMGYATERDLARPANIQGPATAAPPEPPRMERAGVEVPAELMTSGGPPDPKPLKKGA